MGAREGFTLRNPRLQRTSTALRSTHELSLNPIIYGFIELMHTKISEAKPNWFLLQDKTKIAIFRGSKLLSAYLPSAVKLNLRCALQVAAVCQCNAESEGCKTR